MVFSIFCDIFVQFIIKMQLSQYTGCSVLRVGGKSDVLDIRFQNSATGEYGGIEIGIAALIRVSTGLFDGEVDALLGVRFVMLLKKVYCHTAIHLLIDCDKQACKPGSVL